MCCNYNIKIFIITQMIACFVVIDDIQDRTQIRRSQPCWYLYDNIGLGAITDGLMLKSAVFYLIEKHFKGKDCYIDLLETYHDVSVNIFFPIISYKC